MNKWGWMSGRQEGERVRVRVMMESGQLVDEVADIVQTQVIAHKARLSFRNRDAVPLYEHREENHPPSWRENLQVETGLAPPPGNDSRFILEDSLNLFNGIRTGAVEVDPESKFRANALSFAAVGASVLVLIIAGWVTGTGGGGGPTVVAAAEPTAQASRVIRVSAEVPQKESDDGFVDEVVSEKVAPETGAAEATGASPTPAPETESGDRPPGRAGDDKGIGEGERMEAGVEEGLGEGDAPDSR